MRALKSVLVMAGGLKRESADMPEELVLMRALRHRQAQSVEGLTACCTSVPPQ